MLRLLVLAVCLGVGVAGIERAIAAKNPRAQRQLKGNKGRGSKSTRPGLGRADHRFKKASGRELGKRLLQRGDARPSLSERRRATEKILVKRGVNSALARFVVGFYARLDRLSVLETTVRDGGLVRNGTEHASNFATHGLTHVADIVSNVEPVIKALMKNGTIRKRKGKRKQFVEDLATQLASLHDIGNAVDGFSANARKDHRQFAAQITMSASFDEVAASVRQGPVGQYLRDHPALLEGQPVERVVREMLAGAVLHDRVTKEQLNSREALTQHMLDSLAVPLTVADEVGPRSRDKTARAPRYSWLKNRELFEDFRDAAALVVTMSDALRMRGNRLHDSSGAQIAINHATGKALHFKVDRRGVRRPTLAYSNKYSRGDAAIRSVDFKGESLEIALHAPPAQDVDGTASDAGFQVSEILNDTIGRILDLDGRSPNVSLVLRPAAGPEGQAFARLVMEALPDRYRSVTQVGKAKKQEPPRRQGTRDQHKLYRGGTALPKRERTAVLRLLEEGGLPLGLLARDPAERQKLDAGLARARRIGVESGSKLFSRRDLVDYVFVVERGTALLHDGAGQALRLREGAVLGQIAASSINTEGSYADIFVHNKNGASLIAIPVQDYRRHFSGYFHSVEDLEAAIGEARQATR